MYRGIIYAYRCVCNNKYYIGQTIDERRRRWEFLNKERYSSLYTSENLSKFDNARKKYGLDSFEYNVLKEIFLDDKESLINELNCLEVYYIKQYNSFHNGYNSTEGGSNGKLSEETKSKISNSLKGRPMSELTYYKLCLTGYKASDETKLKHSRIAKERFKDKRNHPMFGKHHSDESKAKNSISRKNKCTGKDNKASKPVEVYDLNNNFLNKFNCISDAIKWLNKTYNKNVNHRQPGGICRCCQGKAKTAYGLIWKYAN